MAMLLLAVSFAVTLVILRQLAALGALRRVGPLSMAAADVTAPLVRRRPPARVRRRRLLVAVAKHSLLIAARDRLPRAVRVHHADGADDERAGALGASLAASVRVAQLRRRLHEGAALALDAEHARVLGARDDRRAPLERPRRVRARAAALARPQRRVHGRARRADAAAAGDGRAAVRDVGEVPPFGSLHRDALAGDHPELARRRVLDLPAPPVLPDDPRGVPRRGARRRLR